VTAGAQPVRPANRAASGRRDPATTKEATMIQHGHLTEEQWFALCLRVYRHLRLGDPKLAIGALKDAGFDEFTKSRENANVDHDD